MTHPPELPGRTSVVVVDTGFAGLGTAVRLSEVWAEGGMTAFHGTTVAGLPNLFFDLTQYDTHTERPAVSA